MRTPPLNIRLPLHAVPAVPAAPQVVRPRVPPQTNQAARAQRDAAQAQRDRHHAADVHAAQMGNMAAMRRARTDLHWEFEGNRRDYVGGWRQIQMRLENQAQAAPADSDSEEERLQRQLTEDLCRMDLGSRPSSPVQQRRSFLPALSLDELGAVGGCRRAYQPNPLDSERSREQQKAAQREQKWGGVAGRAGDRLRAGIMSEKPFTRPPKTIASSSSTSYLVTPKQSISNQQRPSDPAQKAEQRKKDWGKVGGRANKRLVAGMSWGNFMVRPSKNAAKTSSTSQASSLASFATSQAGSLASVATSQTGSLASLVNPYPSVPQQPIVIPRARLMAAPNTTQGSPEPQRARSSSPVEQEQRRGSTASFTPQDGFVNTRL